MKIEAKLFNGLAFFIGLLTVVYVTWGLLSGDGIEWMGTIGLIFSTLMTFIVGSYLQFTSNRIDTRPEDYEDAEIADAAGEVGFFSASSFWPILIAFGAACVGIGVALNLIWFAVMAAVIVVFTAGGMVFEYQIGGDKH